MPKNDCPFCEWLKDMRAKESHRLVAEMKASWLVLSASQAYRGYCMLICKTHAEELFQLKEDVRKDFFDDAARASEAIYALLKPDKINYEILGNQVRHLHLHIIPRRNSDPVDAKYAIWGQAMDEPRLAHHDYRGLGRKIAEQLEKTAAPAAGRPKAKKAGKGPTRSKVKGHLKAKSISKKH